MDTSRGKVVTSGGYARNSKRTAMSHGTVSTPSASAAVVSVPSSVNKKKKTSAPELPLSKRSKISGLSEGTAMLSKGATSAMKKSAIDRQLNFIQVTLYNKLEEDVARVLKLDDSSFLFGFYEDYLKQRLLKEVETVKSLKTGGSISPHISNFIPLNKQIMVSPDIVDLAEGVRSEKQLKFYKMMLFKIMEVTNSSLRAAGFKGKVYLKKLFYQTLHNHWTDVVHPVMTQEKADREAEESPGVKVEVASVAEEGGNEIEEEEEAMMEDEEEEEEEEGVPEDEEHKTASSEEEEETEVSFNLTRT
jgi:hypothetical protein